MALAGFLTTAQTITGTHTDFPALLVAANFTNADANALDGTTFSNGGGNVIVYTDQTKTTRVPIEVVEFVTGGTPSVQVWAKHPTMQTGATFWIEADSVQVSQPAVTDTFGRNAVWSSFAAVWHMEEDPSAASPQFLDSTGNGNDASSSGSMTSGDSVAAKIDNGVDFDGVNDFLDAGTNSILELNTQTISCWINPASISYGSTGIIYSKSNSIASSGFEMGLRLASGDLAIAYNDGGIRGWYVASNSNFSTGSLQHCVGIRDAVSGNFRAYKNGSLTDTVSTTTGTISYSSDSALIANQIQNEDFEGVIDELQIRSGVVSSDQIAAEYDNQNAPSTFWTSSDWTAGGGITVTADDISNIQSLTAPLLTQYHLLSVDNIASSQQITEPVITQGYVLSVGNIVNDQSLSNVTLVVAGGLPVQSLSQANEITSPNLTQNHNLSINGISSDQSLTNAELIQNHLLNLDPISNNQDLTNIDLFVGNGLIIQDLETGQEITEPSLTQGNVLITNPISQNQFVGNVILNGQGQDIGVVTAAFKESGIDVKYGVAQFTVKFKD